MATSTSYTSEYVLIRGLNSHGSHLQPLCKLFTVRLNATEEILTVSGYTELTNLCTRDYKNLGTLLEGYQDREFVLKPITNAFEHCGQLYQRCYMVVECKSEAEKTHFETVLQASNYKYEIYDQFPWSRHGNFTGTFRNMNIVK